MNQKNYYRFLLILLGTLSAFGPFVTDFYLPALPGVAKYFDSPATLAQMSLTMSMIGLGLGQLIVGPFSDKYGRKNLLYISLSLFVITTVVCLVSPNILSFVIVRLFQGMAGAGGIVISRSVSTDYYSGRDLTKFLTMIASVNGVAPIVAPVLGGFMLSFTDWRGTFVLLLVLGVMLILAALLLKESLPKERRTTKPLLATFGLIPEVLQNRRYDSYLMVYMLSMVVLFAYISASPFIFQEGYGLSPFMFSLCFAINGLVIIFGCALGGKIESEYRAISLGSGLILLFSIISAIMLILHANVVLVEISFATVLFAYGVLQPPSNSLALSAERRNAGTASAILGASGFLAGGIVSPLVSLGDMFLTTGIIMIIASLLCFVSATLVCRSNSRQIRLNSIAS